MTPTPYRDLAKYGVITDIDPYDLPAGAWSFAVNARFQNGRIQPAPVWRSAGALSLGTPRFVTTSHGAGGTDRIFVGYLNGRVARWANGTETDYSPVGYVPDDNETVWTACSLGDVKYVNRTDRAPWGLLPNTTAFTEVVGWDASWRTRLLKSFNGALVALNVSKGASAYPTLVKTSDIADEVGEMPLSWDHTSPTTNATENPLTELNGPIVDANTLGNAMIIYGSKETWKMTPDGGANVYDYVRLPFDGGAVGANCSVEVDGKHYVFGPNDLWMHDGHGKQSIADGRVRKFVFGTMDASKASRFFVHHDSNLKQVHFCYVSADKGVAFTGTGCNRSAVFDYAHGGTWTFYDLPLVFAGSEANLTINASTWATLAGSWAAMGGAWQDMDGGFKRGPIFVGGAAATHSLVDKLYVLDAYGAESLITAPVDAAATRGMFLERSGIDLDEVGAALSGYKHVGPIYPQGRIPAGSAYIEFAFGSEDHFGREPEYTPYQEYGPTDDLYKLDYDAAGRFLAMRIRYDDYKDVSLSGIDVSLAILGQR